MSNLLGAAGRLFGEPHPGADEARFQVNNTSLAYYQSPYYLLHKDQLQPLPAPAVDPPRLSLAGVLGSAPVRALQAAKRITFHAVGDTGAAKHSGPATEASVADMMVADVEAGGPGAPAFFFHLGDVVYYFGESQYYYDQFYEPFRAYDRPIFAIPGNHDGVVHGSQPDVPAAPTLQAFLRNFCAPHPGRSPDAGSLVRSVMTQPGVYFTLDAPMVSIIGLYTNVLEGPGVISSQGGKYPISDAQLQFLQSELKRLRPARQTGRRAVIIATHHPPLSADAKHGGSTGLARDLDAACQQAGLWPDAVLSGHAHLYQRFTRRTANAEIPYVVSGSGGFAAIKPASQIPPAPHTFGDCTLEVDPLIEFGYLTVTVDMSTATKQLTIAFHSPKSGHNVDRVVVDLGQRKIIHPAGSPTPPAAGRARAAPRPARR
ncbi:MAG TPA: metallophosphoesterase [Opitutaceae bacterium]|nr:metallophosphoesterase [Opitutaceae bacterium]